VVGLGFVVVEPGQQFGQVGGGEFPLERLRGLVVTVLERGQAGAGTSSPLLESSSRTATQGMRGRACLDRWNRAAPEEACDFADDASFKSTVVDSRWGRGALTRGSSAGLLVSHRRRHRNPGGTSVSRVEDPGESSTHLLSCAAALAVNIALCPECS
jgi:hypothetical protein